MPFLWQCACRVAQCPAVDPCRAATSIVRPAVVVDSPAWLARGGVCASGTHKSPYLRLLSEFCLPRRNTALLRPAYVTCVCVCVQVRPIEPRAIYGQDTLSCHLSCVWLFLEPQVHLASVVVVSRATHQDQLRWHQSEEIH